MRAGARDCVAVGIFILVAFSPLIGNFITVIDAGNVPDWAHERLGALRHAHDGDALFDGVI